MKSGPTGAYAMTYVDVFISHYQHDKVKVRALKDRIEGLKFYCYIDAYDTGLSQKKDESVADERAPAERIRPQAARQPLRGR